MSRSLRGALAIGVLSVLGCTGVVPTDADEDEPTVEVDAPSEDDDPDPDDGADQDTEPEEAWHPPAEGELDELGRPAPSRPVAPPPATDIETGKSG